MTPLRTHLRYGKTSCRYFRDMCLSLWRTGRHSDEYRRNFRRWKFRKIPRIFSARSPHEAYHILHVIPLDNEYGICHQRFSKDDVIIDIGAHIGVFSYMARLLGSRQIHTYEADSGNFQLQRQCLGQTTGYFLHHGAVVRSDDPSLQTITHSGYIQENTGGGNVIMKGRAFEFCRQELVTAPEQSTTAPSQTITLDEILTPFDKVKLLKIDCEGSEFPILLTSRLLHRVERIVGEYHEIEPAMMAHLDPGAIVGSRQQYRKEDLAEALSKHGFTVTFQQRDRCMGIFDASRAPSL